MTTKTTLMNTSAGSALLHPSMMTPAERAAGRFLRAPDGHDGGEGGGGADAPAEGADAGAQGKTGGEAEAGSGGDAADAGKAGDQGKVASEGNADEGSIAGGAGAAGDGGEAKGEGDGDEDGDAGEPAVVLVGAPEGDYEVKAPEGMDFDTAAFDAVKDDFRAMNLSNDGAQKMIDLYAAKVLPVLTARAKEQGEEAQKADMARLKKEWGDAARADPDVGGANYQQTVDRIARVWDRLGVKPGEGARAILDDSGLGNHPDMLKLLAFAGSRLEESKFERPQGGGADNRPIWDRVYPDPEPAK